MQSSTTPDPRYQWESDKHHKREPRGILYQVNKTCHKRPASEAIFEPRHDISNNVVCATSEASDQPAQTRSLIRAFAGRLNIL